MDESFGMLTKRFSEWICPEHSGFAREKFKQWWGRMTRAAIPNTVQDCLCMMDSNILADVKSITVKKDGKWDRVVHHQIGPRPFKSEWLDESMQEDAFEAEIPF